MPVTIFVSPDFGKPVGLVRAWLASSIGTFRAAVPEATMHKYAYSPSDEDKIGFSGQRWNMKAVSAPGRMQISTDKQFWLRVLAANPRHHA